MARQLCTQVLIGGQTRCLLNRPFDQELVPKSAIQHGMASALQYPGRCGSPNMQRLEGVSAAETAAAARDASSSSPQSVANIIINK